MEVTEGANHDAGNGWRGRMEAEVESLKGSVEKLWERDEKRGEQITDIRLKMALWSGGLALIGSLLGSGLGKAIAAAMGHSAP